MSVSVCVRLSLQSSAHRTRRNSFPTDFKKNSALFYRDSVSFQMECRHDTRVPSCNMIPKFTRQFTLKFNTIQIRTLLFVHKCNLD